MINAKDKHPWTGKKIGDLEIKELIGSGRSASVLRAYENPPGRVVAVKVLSPEFCSDEKHVASFIQEARRAAKLKHPNILRVYRVALYKGLYFIVMEYAERGTLQDMLDKRGRLPLGEAVQLLRQAAEGLAYAAEKGVVHRDVKPQNLLVGANGAIKVADLGIAGLMGEKNEEGDTLFGSPHYIAPEQARGEPASSQSDIYSLGVALYHALTGRTPFKDQPIRSLIICHFTEMPPPVNKLVPTLPRRVSDIVDTMMAKEPEDRYQTFEQVLSELDALEKIKTFDQLKLKNKRRKEG